MKIERHISKIVRGKSGVKYMKAFIFILFTFILLSPTSAQSYKDRLEAELILLPHPLSVEDFSPIPSLSPMNQDSTLVCWSFATSSFIESEMKRLGKEQVRLSVMFPVYYAFIEKAKRFVQSYGQSRFNPGDLFSGVIDVSKQYGAVPTEAYEGRKTEQVFYNHNALYEELELLMKKVKITADWNEKKVLKDIKTILNKHLGVPPGKFTFNGKEYTPISFFSEIVNLPWERYIIVTSFQYAPFNQFIELKVPDNWKYNANYFNVPLEVFYTSLKDAVTHGYSLAIDMDNSEPSYRITKQYAFIPEYEVPRDSLIQSIREEQFQSGATTDDHLMHIISYQRFGREDWFLAKDSWRTAWEGPNHGYFFFHESYVKLKVLAYLVHLDGVPEIVRLLPSK